MKHNKGFTLLEILIALFIFTFLSMILATALHNLMGTQAGTDANAERLRNLQMALLIVSRDVEQTVNRPIRDPSGKEEAAFIGSSHYFIFTHTGLANPTGVAGHSSLQRTRYFWDAQALWRLTWATLDQAPQSKSHTRSLLENISEANFQYLDNNGRFQNHWPVQSEANQVLPKAVKITLTIPNWGKISQLYVISAQANKLQPQPSPQDAEP